MDRQLRDDSGVLLARPGRVVQPEVHVTTTAAGVADGDNGLTTGLVKTVLGHGENAGHGGNPLRYITAGSRLLERAPDRPGVGEKRFGDGLSIESG
jgi:hypothetical protein